MRCEHHCQFPPPLSPRINPLCFIYDVLLYRQIDFLCSKMSAKKGGIFIFLTSIFQKESAFFSEACWKGKPHFFPPHLKKTTILTKKNNTRLNNVISLSLCHSRTFCLWIACVCGFTHSFVVLLRIAFCTTTTTTTTSTSLPLPRLCNQGSNINHSADL